MLEYAWYTCPTITPMLEYAWTYPDEETLEAAMETLRESLEKVSEGVSSKPAFFTFVPVMKKLPMQGVIAEGARDKIVLEKLNKNSAAPGETAARDTMTDGGLFKAEVIYIKDSEEGGAGNTVRGEARPHLTHLPDHVNLPPTSPASHVAHEYTAGRCNGGPASMETAVDKHGGISQQQCHQISPAAEVSSGFFANRLPASENRTSPANSVDLFPTPASSRESILSEGWDKERSWCSNRASPTSSFSQVASPCSSVRSGVFSPAVVQVKRHSLAPGFSLVHMPSSCFSSSESLSSSSCSAGARSPPPRHRPPLTRLSLLTAILRKGRLPVLSAALQRPYSPCWPVNSVTLSSCKACSAASSVASIPFEVSSRCPTRASADDHASSHHPRESYRYANAPPPVMHSRQVDSKGPQTTITRGSYQPHLNNGPRWQRVVSPPPAQSLPESFARESKTNVQPQVQMPPIRSPQPKLPPNLAFPKETSEPKTPQRHLHSYVKCATPESREFKPADTQMDFGGRAAENNTRFTYLTKSGSPSPKPPDVKGTSVLNDKAPRPDSSSVSRNALLSLQPESLPTCPTDPHPPLKSRPASSVRRYVDSVSPPPAPPCIGRGEAMAAAGQSSPKSAGNRRPRTASRADCLSPSRYTPIAFPGWPSPSHSPPSTPDRFTLTPSPALTLYDLTPSPSLSLRSTPSPRLWGGVSDCNDREGKKRKPHKIKSSYKSLAAIPTNTLLLDQQKKLQSMSLPRNLGSQTTNTKPGVIRPMAAIPRLSEENSEEEHRPNPFRQYLLEPPAPHDRKLEDTWGVETGEDAHLTGNQQALNKEGIRARTTPLPRPAPLFSRPEDKNLGSMAHGPQRVTAPSFSPAEAPTAALEIHI
ncbi:muscular LMNA-interacting protein [Lampris incognitus]|uniref:muscular LMNA-interacting protein n=1 Tax=Lampris incognitus TaxID=2546036 RepID=UPI0024B4E63C|nr:muscular LMNA-interacting protein [Lampris incognitus]